MDVQLKRGLLETCILASLLNKDSYGYQIIKDTSQYTEISESTLYPILTRLETQKCLKEYKVEYNGRLRKYYSITDIGREKVQTFINEWQEVDNVYRYILQEVKK